MRQPRRLAGTRGHGYHTKVDTGKLRGCSTLSDEQYEPSTKFAVRSISGSVPLRASYSFAPVERGTPVLSIAELAMGGFFGGGCAAAQRRDPAAACEGSADAKALLESESLAGT